MNEEEVIESASPAMRRRLHRLALGFTVGLIVVVIALLPIAVRSMQEVLGRGPDQLYNLATGQPVELQQADDDQADSSTYFNFGLVGLDESTGQVTIAVSGNRACTDACPKLDLVLASLDDDADQRRGLPPSSTLSLSPEDKVFSESVTLPVRGQPSLYPFDTYTFWMGVGGTATASDGTVTEITPQSAARISTVTLQNRIPDMIMRSPEVIDPDRIRAVSDPYGFHTVTAITIARPAYLQVLAIVLVALIAVSAAMALLTRGLDELALGFGGLILGVWGIRSILMPQSLPTVTAIDLALSWVILLLLLGLALRAALHFLRLSELPIPARTQSGRPRAVKRRRKGGTAED
ncbi:MAG: hypothetical protein QM692_05740 [Thermomicrobiales bacterium]